MLGPLTVIMFVMIGAMLPLDNALAEWRSMVTPQLVGTEVSEGDPDASFVQLAAECSEASDKRSLRCHFNKVIFSKGKDGCSLVASAWVMDLRLVTRTKTEVVWARTQGPGGRAGGLYTNTLSVQIGETSQKLGGQPGWSDQWEYVQRVSYSNPNPLGRGPWTPTTTQVSGPKWPDIKTARVCLPTRVMVDAQEPP